MNHESHYWGSRWYRASFACFGLAGVFMGLLALCILVSQWGGWDLFAGPSASVFTGLTLIVSVLLSSVGSMCGVIALSIREDQAPAMVPTLCNLLLVSAIVSIVVLGGMA